MGSDADPVIFDPKREHTISAKTHHMRVDYSMFEGIKVTGMPTSCSRAGACWSKATSFLASRARVSLLNEAPAQRSNIRQAVPNKLSSRPERRAASEVEGPGVLPATAKD